MIIDSLLDWNDQGTQGKVETNIYRIIEDTINSNIAKYFNNSQVHFITGNFTSSTNFLDSFYKANPDIGSIVNETIRHGIEPIQLILRGIRVEKPLDYYDKNFSTGLKALQNFSRIIQKNA